VSEFFETPRTNNEAEYGAIIMGLTYLIALGVRNVTIRTDSQLVVKQVDGTYKCRKDTLKPLLERVHTLKRDYERSYGPLTLVHTRAHSGTFGNEHADQFANDAVDGMCSLYRVGEDISEWLHSGHEYRRPKRRRHD
jgi:ribonuclease HI